jgi:hypothetical protein
LGSTPAVPRPMQLGKLWGVAVVARRFCQHEGPHDRGGSRAHPTGHSLDTRWTKIVQGWTKLRDLAQHFG